jgi:AhpC/TSA family
VSDEPEGVPEREGSQARPPREPRRRLDPDRAARTRRTARRQPPAAIDTKRYQRIIGLFGLLVVIVISVAFITSRPAGTAGVPPGQRIDRFAAPLATSSLNGAANLHPTCTPARHDPRALNVCLIVNQTPLVLGFFVTNSAGCERAVTALQTVSREFPASDVQFAAVAVRASHTAAARAVRAHRWTIPVAYDEDGRVGAAYGLEVCPIIELAYRGGVVARRLIGEHWNSSITLAAQVRGLLAGAQGAG